MSQFSEDQAISYEVSAELISDATVLRRLDIGHSVICHLDHPVEGPIVVLSSSVGQSALLHRW